MTTIDRSTGSDRQPAACQIKSRLIHIKHVFGFAKVRYRGLKKNTHRLLVTCALANLFICVSLDLT